jgi:hypothetical protein
MIEWVKGLFRKKKKLNARFIDEVGHSFDRKVKYVNNTFSISIQGVEQTYIVDMACVIYERKKKLPTSVYYVGNPNPLRFSHLRNKDVDSISFKQILDSKVVTDLFTSGLEAKVQLLIILVAINLAVSVITMMAALGFLKFGGKP